MEQNAKKSMLVLDGNTETFEKIQGVFNNAPVNLYFSRSTYEAAKILFTKQIDAVLALKGFSHAVDTIRLFSTVPCTSVICQNGENPGGADYTIKDDDFEISLIPEYLKKMVQLNDIRVKFAGIVWFNKLKVDIDNYSVEYEGTALKLKPLEIKLLFYLCKHLNRVVSRRKLLANVWGYDDVGATRTLDVHIMAIRSLLSRNDIPLEIQTFRGEGYKIFDTETLGGEKYLD